MSENQEKIKEDLDNVMKHLKIEGVDNTTGPESRVGLGDIVEGALKKVGITEDRYKEVFGLRECGCTQRKKFLNGLFSWYIENKDKSDIENKG